MYNVTSTRLPAQSRLAARVEKSDYLDCYYVKSALPPRRAAEIITDFPGWGRFLLHVRRLVTTPFGLSNDGPDAPDKIGVFPVEIESSEEIIAGFNDKHLNFRVSVISKEGRVFLATWVHTHNIGGWIYLAAILPFHILIVRDALCRVSAEG